MTRICMSSDYRVGHAYGFIAAAKGMRLRWTTPLILIGAVWLGMVFENLVSVNAAHAGRRVATETSAAAKAESTSGLLDGLSFSGPTGAIGMGRDHDEIVAFVDGKFRSLECEKWGFEQREYSAKLVGDAVSFEAIHVSADYGTMTWRGTVRDGRLEAHYVWEKERLFWNTRREYWFNGVISEADHGRDYAF